MLFYMLLVFVNTHQALADDPITTLENKNTAHHIFSSGEQIGIVVFGEEELSQIYHIDDTGVILFPMIGKVHVTGKNASEINTIITNMLRDGYILNPVLSVYATTENHITDAIKKTIPEPSDLR